jgi:hypothetical protein
VVDDGVDALLAAWVDDERAALLRHPRDETHVGLGAGHRVGADLTHPRVARPQPGGRSIGTQRDYPDAAAAQPSYAGDRRGKLYVRYQGIQLARKRRARRGSSRVAGTM